MLNKKADSIEEYILQRLAKQPRGWIDLKRAELASIIDCAPSQISYVLNTRFTQERGFEVNSRRGLGGYIRVTIITDAALEKKIIFENLIDRIDGGTTYEEINSMLGYLIDKRLITPREASLVSRTALSIYRSEEIGDDERVRLIRDIFGAIADIS